jgi:hypothetical protein
VTRWLTAPAAALRRLRIERAVGAPWPMVRFYVRIELRHGLSGHDGAAQSCNRCYGLEE